MVNWVRLQLTRTSELLVRHGVTPDKMAVCHCGTGRKATSSFLVLKGRVGVSRVTIHGGSHTEEAT